MTIKHKRGTTFRTRITMSTDPEALSGAAVTATAMARRGTWCAALTVRILDDDPRMVEIEAADTADWPLALLACDVRAARAEGEIFATETFYINCIPEVTR